MISLLPVGYKEDVLYARRNKRLLRWAVAGGIALLLMVGLVFVGQLFIKKSTGHYAAQNEAIRQRLQGKELQEAKGQVESFSNNFKLVIQVLSKEILFSKLIKQIGAVMPDNTVLTGIELSKLEGGLNLKALAKDYTTATQVQVNLQDPGNKVFEKVDIEGVQCSTAAAASTGSASAPSAALSKLYPCQIDLRALFGKNNPYLFISTEDKAKR